MKKNIAGPIVLFIIGLIMLIRGIAVALPVYTAQVEENEFLNNCETVKATITNVHKIAGMKYDITYEYEYNGSHYTNTANNITAYYVKSGAAIEVDVNKSDPSDSRYMLLQKIPAFKEKLDEERMKVYVKYGAMAVGGLMLIVVGFIVLKTPQKKNIPSPNQFAPPRPAEPERPRMTQPIPTFGHEEDNNSLYGGAATLGQPREDNNSPYGGAATFGQPQEDNNSPYGGAATFGQPDNNDPVFSFDNEDKSGSAGFSKPFGSSSDFGFGVGSSYASLDPDPEPEPQPQPQPEPEPDPEPEPAPAAPSEPVDLSSIIRSGNDGGYSKSADDYVADASLEALIKKGSDDPFRTDSSQYEADPSLQGLIKSGTENPLISMKKPRKKRPKRDQ